ncbi:MAG: glycine--tRNA ligase subunit beta [Azoarcus sp.]|jgi:glycyl-tRNA synthetase beta chain|nr:glycine--tRNA ligase subunit beta [Azoarcus sp.]
MTSENLLLEIFVEELPPRALKNLGEAFASALAASLARDGLAGADALVTAYATPRRLAVHVTNVLAAAADKPVTQKLMPVSVGLDAAGNATPALLKKLAALGAEASAVAGLRREGEGKAETLYLDSIARGATLAAGLQTALEAALAALPIPKVMSYQLADGWTSVHFVRPAHALVALHGAQVVPVAVLGLTAGNATHGHRFEASADPVLIAHADAYAKTLFEQGAVIASFAERRTEIARQLAAAAQKAGADLHPIEDEALLDEVTALVERPNVLIGQFEPEFLAVPQECLILTMKANQKYFPLLDAGGKLANRFLVVSNLTPGDPSAIIGGNERVVRPRLADAKFFFDQDRKKTLESRLPLLAKVVYHNKLGSQGQRSERVVTIVNAIVNAIARAIAEQPGGSESARQAASAARLAKADLLTDMVGEFPELQGTMGRYYALNDGLAPEVADAIEDHYKPRFAGDALPRGKAGIVVALADKLETLAGMFGIGQAPTGDKDPFSLRRHAIGVIRMLMESDLDLALDEAIAAANAAFTAIDGFTPAGVPLRDFIYERLVGLLREQGYTAHEIDAVVSLQPQHLDEIPRRLAAVRAFSALPQAEALAAANKRVGNILKKTTGDAGDVIDAALLREDAEQALARALDDIAPRADAAFGAGDYTASLKTLAALRAPVDEFFDKVMVNAEEAALRANRLALLKRLRSAMNRVADLSKLSG